MDIVEVSEDMSLEERESLKKYQDSGNLGLNKITEEDISQFLELYMAGNTYSEIAKTTGKNKSIILHLSSRDGWLLKRKKHFNEISLSISNKIINSKLDSANSLMLMQTALSKYIGAKAIDYIKTGDAAHIEGMDSKTLQNFFKTIESLDKLLNNNKGESVSSPRVDINVTGSNPKIEDSEDGVKITTENEKGDILSILASYKKSNSK